MVWNGIVLNIETVLMQNWIVSYKTVLTLTVCKQNLYLY